MKSYEKGWKNKNIFRYPHIRHPSENLLPPHTRRAILFAWRHITHYTHIAKELILIRFFFAFFLPRYFWICILVLRHAHSYTHTHIHLYISRALSYINFIVFMREIFFFHRLLDSGFWKKCKPLERGGKARQSFYSNSSIDLFAKALGRYINSRFVWWVRDDGCAYFLEWVRKERVGKVNACILLWVVVAFFKYMYVYM